MVRAERSGEQLVLSAADTGHGVPEDVRAQLSVNDLAVGGIESPALSVDLWPGASRFEA